METEKYIELLKREQTELTRSSLLNPRGKDAFELGLICGMAQAYERMQQILQEHQDAADGKPRKPDQRPARPVNPYLADLDNAPLLPEQYGRR